METPGRGDDDQVAPWVEGEIDLPPGSPELDEAAIAQLRMLYTDEIMRQFPDLTLDQLAVVVDQAMQQIVPQINHVLAVEGFTEETMIPLAMRLRPGDSPQADI